ncbi:unnamed protein product [Cunninghamella blakesleeana]
MRPLEKLNLISFSTNGITQLETLAQLSMQDYGSLGIVSIQDRKKLFQLVQSLRQELPTLENGLVSSNNNNNNNNNNSNAMYRRQSRPTATRVDSSSTLPASYVDPTTGIALTSSSASIMTSGGIPDISTIPMNRRNGSTNSNMSSISNSGNNNNNNLNSGNGSPNLYQTSTLLSSTPPKQQQQQSPVLQQSTMTRSRSRTLPDQHQRPDFIKSMKSSNNNPPPFPGNLLQQQRISDEDDEEEDDEDMPEIRRGSNPLVNAYGIPIQNSKLRSPYNQAKSSLNSTSSSNFGMNNNNNNNNTSVNNNSNNMSSGNNNQLGQSDLNQKIRVCVRKRPLNKKEIERGEKDISPTSGIRSININEPKVKVDLTKYIEQHSFTFDDVFDVEDSNEKIYQRTAQPLVKYVFSGGKATCFAYGQTGSGKTFTMLDPRLGLYVLAARDVFNLLCQPQYQHLSAYIGFYEIYQGQLYDLLNARKKLFAREDGKQNVVIAGLKEYVIKNVDDLMKVFEYGSQCRSTGSTGANSDSSRSHAILQILLKPTKNRKVIVGKLSFIDLAGSERGADRGETDVKTRMEGAEINKSLLALKECIRALDQDKRHTPFRQSKLTQVLKDSFVGHSRTCMIATISPNQSNSEHTLNTLRYADRVKELKGERDRRGMSDMPPASKGRNDDSFGEEGKNSSESLYVNQNYEDYNGYSDDPDLYNEDDDDLFLGDEDFPSDGDVHILDEDFPHETTLDDDSGNNADDMDPDVSIAQLRQRYFDDDDDDDDQFTSNRPKRQPTPYHHTLNNNNNNNSNNNTTIGTTAGGLAQYHNSPLLTGQNDLDDIQQQFNNNLLISKNDNIESSMPRSRQSSGRRPSMEQQSSSSSLFTNRTSMPSPRLQHQQLQQQHQQQKQYQQHHHQHHSSFDSDTPIFDTRAIDEFVKFHRAEIRETGECSKKETKLLTHFSLNMSSRKDIGYDDDDDPLNNNHLYKKDPELLRQQQREGMEKTMVDFHQYLNNLDEVLEMKMAAIEALRDRVRTMLGEDDEF